MQSHSPPHREPPVTAVDPRTAAKRAAGEAAVDRFVQDGMRVGLGTGSTAVWAVRRIGARLADGTLHDIAGVPTSGASEQEARACGIPLATLDRYSFLDVTIDGADEVSPRLDLIKGGGGAHLREKIVAQASGRLVIVVDETKLVPELGTGFAVPVEVVPMAQRPEREFLEQLGARVTSRSGPDGRPFVTDEGNRILDADFGPLPAPAVLLEALRTRAGVVEVGLFLDMASVVVVAGPDAEVRMLERVSPES
jgi:ribose 5-phosphate isomerase A